MCSVLICYPISGLCGWDFSRGTSSFGTIVCKFNSLQSSLNTAAEIMTVEMWIQVSTAWGIGLIIGPALGGFLAQVCYILVPCHVKNKNFEETKQASNLSFTFEKILYPANTVLYITVRPGYICNSIKMVKINVVLSFLCSSMPCHTLAR